MFPLLKILQFFCGILKGKIKTKNQKTKAKKGEEK